MPGSGEFSQDPGWLARTAHWSEGENLRTDSLRPRSVYRTLSKTGRRIVVLCRRPHPPEGHESGDVVHHHLCSLLGGGEFGQGNEMGPFWRTIHHRQNHGVASRWGKARDKIKGQVWPRARGDGQRLQQTNRRLVRSLILSTHRASQHKLSDILGHGWPPKSLTDGGQRSPNPWMTGYPRFVTPPEDLRTQRSRHKQPTLRTPPWDLPLPHGLLYPPLDIPREGPHHHPLGENGVRSRIPPRTLEQTRKGVGLGVLGTRPIREGEVKPPKVECPAGLASIQPPGRTDIFQVLVIRPDQEGPLLPPTNGATPPEPAWLPAAPCYLCHNFVLQGSDGERKRHRGAPSHL